VQHRGIPEYNKEMTITLRTASAVVSSLALSMSLGCPPDAGDPEYIPGSTACWMPPGYEGLELPLVGTADEDADAFFADDALPLFELSFPQDSWAEICENASEYADYMWELAEGLEPADLRHDYAPATLEFQGETYTDVGVRFRGRTTLYALFYDGDQPRPDAMQRCLDRELGRKPSLKISMDEFGNDVDIADQQTFNLVSREGNDSVYLREVLALRMANQFDVVAPRAGHARVCFNGEYEGLFSLVEEADTSRFLRQRFGDIDGGDYWKVETDGEQTWSESWDESGNWRGDYIPKGGTDDSDPGSLKDLLLAGSLIEGGASAGEIEATLDGLVDAEQWLREIAVDMVIPDYDGMFGNHKNHLLYDHPEQGFVVVPYDKDLAFVDLEEYAGGECPGDIMGGHPCWASVREGPAVAQWLLDQNQDEYRDLVQDFVDEVMDPDEVASWLRARAEAMRPWLEADRYYREGSPACIDDPEVCGYYTMDAWEWGVDPYLIEVVQDRADEVQRQLDGGAPCDDPCGDG
jgi:spore coat protein CotH